NDMVIHTEKTGMMRLIVEIKYVGKTADVFDKETWSFDGLQLEQMDLNYVHALNEPRLHDIRVVSNKHEVDQHLSCTDPLPIYHLSQICSIQEEECSRTLYSLEIVPISCHSIFFNCRPENEPFSMDSSIILPCCLFIMYISIMLFHESYMSFFNIGGRLSAPDRIALSTRVVIVKFVMLKIT
nr:hypothetical protein [Tanacetum cinerariifolium]